ncbi:GNAT family N-acetyltransferase [Butyrivibrio sp. AE3006]|uniref:GNAT family N-acetyltransferase n=1 Tax=Butyrivibrio sp. AE3006 TaxID=1280673 RepID=UPI00041BF2B1|nr:GNAT family N-acetyltransferase [Butyrivibrio sp. AE3006]
MAVTIETERLILKKWTDSDAEKLYAMACDPLVGEGAGWLPHSDVEYSRAIIRSVLTADGEFAIRLKDTEDPIGSMGFRIGDSPKRGIENKDEAEIGYWVGRDYWNRGFATEALTELIRYLFEEVGIRRIWCGYFDGNVRSERVITKCGLKFHHRNENRYNSMLKKNYNETMMCMSAEEYFENKKTLKRM